MDNIVELKDHLDFKYVHGNKFSEQSKDKVFVFKMLINLVGSGMDFVKCIQV